MASSGGNRQPGGRATGGGNRPGGSSGNRAGSGNRKRPSSDSQASSSPRQASAAQRARQRVEQGGSVRPVRARTQPARGGRRPPGRGGRSTTMTAGIFGGTFVVLAAVIIIVISLVTGSSGGKGADKWVAPFPATPTVAHAVLNVPNSELAAAGNGGSAVYGVGPKGSGASIVVLSGGKPLTKDGKPMLVYFGSEYCPYCAATRWPLAIALSKFGTLTGLEETASSYLDAFPGTHTLTFAKAKYSSPYLVFDETEQLTNHCRASAVIANPQGGTPAYVCNNLDYYPLQTPTKQVINLINQYDNGTYFGAADAQGAGIPFIDIGGKYVESGALYDPTILQGATWDQIVAAFHEPTTGVGQVILGAANRYIAMICEATGNRPPICSQSFVKSAEKAL
jgi:thiol-disulfide isomerase/thioredoxin